MDESRFDAVSRALGRARSRRGLARLLSVLALGTSLAPLGVAETVSKHKKHKQKRATTSPPSPPPVSPPAPIPVLTYLCPGPKDQTALGGATTRFAQTFTAAQGGSLRQIQFN